MRSFASLSEKEILALAISLEEEDARIYGDFAESLCDSFPASANVFKGMQHEEEEHARRLMQLFKDKFGDHIPLIRRDDIKGFIKHKPIWMVKPLGVEAARSFAAMIELETQRFYERAASRSQDASIKLLLTDLAREEAGHIDTAAHLEQSELTPEVRDQEKQTSRRIFLLQVVQPGLPV
jgi:rubrerythrin